MGTLMLLLWAIRFFVFKLYESPKYLMGRGRDEKAVEVVHQVAAYNGTSSKLSLEDLRSLGDYGKAYDPTNVQKPGAVRVLKKKLEVFDGNHVKPLFATRKLAYSTTLLIILWGECEHPLYFRSLILSLRSSHRACVPSVSLTIGLHRDSD